jgi:O-antigen/teichoic acid export membrane protein
MSTVTRVTKNTLWLTLAEIAGKGVGFVIALIVARYLGPENYGYYAFAISFVTLFQVVVDFGLRPLLVRELARDLSQAGKYVGNFVTIKILLSAAMFGVVAVGLWLYGAPINLFYLTIIATIYVVFMSFEDMLRGVFQASEKMKYETIVRVVTKFAVLAFTVVVVLMGLWTEAIMWALVAGTFIGTVATFIICHKYFVKIKLQIDKAFLKTALRQSVLFAITNIFIAIYFKIDTVMLESMRGAQEVGYYNTAYELVFAFMFIPSVVSGAIYPAISRFFQEDKNKIGALAGRLIKYYTIVAVALVIFLTLLGAPLIRLFFGAEYEPAIPLFQILTFVLIFVFVNFLVGTLLNASNKQHVSTIVAGICAGVNIALNLVLIPPYGAAGAAVATIITEAVLGLISYIYLHRRLYPLFSMNNLSKLGRLLLAIIATGALAYYLGRWNIYIATPVSLLAFAGMIFGLRLFTSKDRDYVREIMSLRKNKVRTEIETDDY